MSWHRNRVWCYCMGMFRRVPALLLTTVCMCFPSPLLYSHSYLPFWVSFPHGCMHEVLFHRMTSQKYTETVLWREYCLCWGDHAEPDVVLLRCLCLMHVLLGRSKCARCSNFTQEFREVGDIPHKLVIIAQAIISFSGVQFLMQCCLQVAKASHSALYSSVQ